MKDGIIEASKIKLQKSKKEILDVEHFQLAQGEVRAVIGPNGAGKSTLLQVLALLQRPSSGQLFFRGEIVNSKNILSIRRRMAVVFQEALLLDTTVYKNVASGLQIRGHRKKEIDGLVWEWLERLGIRSLAHRPARFLSGGESQRVSLVRAFALEPEVLFLDEPFSPLDYPTKKGLIDELRDILQATRISTILVTHDYHEIPVLADSVTVLDRGKVIQSCSQQEIFQKPANDVVASLLGVAEKNRRPGR
jgi:tungstate transport system ATP-binding protein